MNDRPPFEDHIPEDEVGFKQKKNGKWMEMQCAEIKFRTYTFESLFMETEEGIHVLSKSQVEQMVRILKRFLYE